jgi:hypothetical protein
MEMHVSVIATPSFQFRAAAAATVAAVLSLGLASVARADRTVAQTVRPTGVAAGQGLLAFSAYDPSINAYRLMIARGGTVRRASVAPSPTRFDVDVGPTASGRPYVVYSRCTDRSEPVPRGCDIYAYDPDAGRENRYDASSPTESDVHPTYWRGRLAFVRYYGSADDPRPIVYTRAARSSRPSQRLPGLPSRRCLVRGGCGEVTGTVDELELYGDHLAETVHTVTHAQFARRQTEVRLVGVHDERSEQIAARGVGESGQAFIGPAFAAGRLYTYFTCHGDPGGCLNGIGGYYRYRYSTGDWAKEATSTQLAGFAVSNLGTFVQPTEAPACGSPTTTAPACRVLERVPEPDYRPIAEAPRSTA